MAETKNHQVSVTPAAKAVAAAKTADTKTEEVKAAPAASVAVPKEETKKEEPKKTPGRKPGVKKTAAAKKTTAKKTAAAKKTTAKTTEKAAKTTKTPGRKAAVKETLTLQFAGKEYTTEALVKIAKDVWKYDLKQKVGDFKTVELYVKPEENRVYFKINGEVTGDFGI